jgi:hypothetical protein
VTGIIGDPVSTRRRPKMPHPRTSSAKIADRGQALDDRAIHGSLDVALALKLFELNRISSGRAAEICGLPRIDFLLTAGRMGIPVVDLDESEMNREFEKNIEDLAVIAERRAEPTTSHADLVAELKRDGLL